MSVALDIGHFVDDRNRIAYGSPTARLEHAPAERPP